MVRSLNELVYEIIELYRPNYVVTDSIDERLVATWIQATRAKILTQDLNQPMRTPDPHCIQDLGIIEMIPVDSTIFTPTVQGKTVLMSVNEIPTPLNTKEGPTLTFVGPADSLNFKFRLLPKENALNAGNGKFNKNTVYAYYENNRIFLISKSGLHKGIIYIRVKGIFANPIDAWEFAHPGQTYDWDYEYPISENVVNDIKNIIVQENFKLILTPFTDNIPNNIDNLTLPEAQQPKQ